MKLLTYLIYTLLALHFMGCDFKKEGKWERKLKKEDTIKMSHPDSIRKYREIRWTEKKEKIDAKFDSLRVAKDTI